MGGALGALWFHATVTALHPATQTCDIEYKAVALEPRFGSNCDDTTFNILLPDLCISIEGLAIDLIDRSSRQDTYEGAREVPSLIGARWDEPSRILKEAGVIGTLVLNLKQPILFHLVAEAARLSLLGKGALLVLNRLIGERTLLRIEADVELSGLQYNLIFREDGAYWTISKLEMEIARDGDVRCRSAEGGFVEWLVRAIPAKVLAFVKKALQDNLGKEQLLFLWQGDARVIGAFDGLLRKLEYLEELKAAAKRRLSPRSYAGARSSMGSATGSATGSTAPTGPRIHSHSSSSHPI